jgi:hypothetical protein
MVRQIDDGQDVTNQHVPGSCLILAVALCSLYVPALPANGAE